MKNVDPFGRLLLKMISTAMSALLLVAFFCVLGPVQAAPFARIDSGPGTPGFEERFLGTYGVNSAIEPAIGSQDRPLYERVAPFLREDPQRAIDEVKRELGRNSNPAFRYLLGNLYYQTEEVGEAEKYLKEAIEEFPDFRRAHRTLGLIYVQEERFEEAVETWLKVITLGGGDAQSYGLLGYSYLALDQFESALTAYRNARMFRPDSVDFRRGQAHSLLQMGEWRQAVALFDELIAENPELPELWFSQANALMHLERYGEAITNLELVQSLGKMTAASQFLLGDLYLREGNYRLAVVQYRRAISESDSWNVAQALRPLQYLFGHGLIEEARSYLDELRPLLPENLEPKEEQQLVMAEARLARAAGEVEVARERLEELTTADPLHGPGLLLLGEIYQEENDFGQAEFYFTRALSVPDSQVDARIALGRLEVNRGDFEAALKHLRAAYELDPRPTLSRYIESIENR